LANSLVVYVYKKLQQFFATGKNNVVFSGAFVKQGCYFTHLLSNALPCASTSLCGTTFAGSTNYVSATLITVDK
jgi:hypothetical protein